MNRRTFTGLVAASALRGAPPLTDGSRTVVIAGAGIIGASIAYHLAKRGAQVIVLEKAHPASGATEKSFAWINASFSKRPRPYYELNFLGTEGWRRLQLELGGELQAQWVEVSNGMRRERRLRS